MPLHSHAERILRALERDGRAAFFLTPDLDVEQLRRLVSRSARNRGIPITAVVHGQQLTITRLDDPASTESAPS